MKLLLILTLLLPINLNADETTCRATLTKCDLAVHALQQVNSDQAEQIKIQQSLNDSLQSKINEDSFWKPLAEGALVVVILETLILALKK